MRKTILAVAAATLLPLASASANEAMSATVTNLDGEGMGTVTFEPTPSGMLVLTLEVDGLPEGVRAFHVHETGECDAATEFKSAGGHYAGGKAHGVLVEDGPHPGDFPNVYVPESGMLRVQFFTDRLSVGSEGTNPLADEDGSAVIFHSGADDYESQPAGAAGSRIACGVIN